MPRELREFNSRDWSDRTAADRTGLGPSDWLDVQLERIRAYGEAKRAWLRAAGLSVVDALLEQRDLRAAAWAAELSGGGRRSDTAPSADGAPAGGTR